MNFLEYQKASRDCKIGLSDLLQAVKFSTKDFDLSWPTDATFGSLSISQSEVLAGFLKFSAKFSVIKLRRFAINLYI